MITTIEEQVGAPDPELEDEDDFEDVKGVVSREQAAQFLEILDDELDKPVVFDETLIPTGGVKEVSAELAATLSLS